MGCAADAGSAAAASMPNGCSPKEARGLKCWSASRRTCDRTNRQHAGAKNSAHTSYAFFRMDTCSNTISSRVHARTRTHDTHNQPRDSTISAASNRRSNLRIVPKVRRGHPRAHGGARERALRLSIVVDEEPLLAAARRRRPRRGGGHRAFASPSPFCAEASLLYASVHSLRFAEESAHTCVLCGGACVSATQRHGCRWPR